MHTLHRYQRRKKDGTPAAGVKFRYEIHNEHGDTVAKRETNHDGFVVASLYGRSWSYASNRSAVKRDARDIAYLVNG